MTVAATCAKNEAIVEKNASQEFMLISLACD